MSCDLLLIMFYRFAWLYRLFGRSVRCTFLFWFPCLFISSGEGFSGGHCAGMPGLPWGFWLGEIKQFSFRNVYIAEEMWGSLQARRTRRALGCRRCLCDRGSACRGSRQRLCDRRDLLGVTTKRQMILNKLQNRCDMLQPSGTSGSFVFERTCIIVKTFPIPK